MNLQHLYYFRAMVEYEHYGKAAEELMTSQSSVSYAITALEEELGVPLFHKYGRNIKITKYGRVFVQYVEDAIACLEAGAKEIQDLAEPNLQTSVIGCMESLSTQCVLDLIKRFKSIEKNCDISFELLQMDTNEMLESLKDGEISLCFGNRIDDKDVVSIPIFRERFVLIVPAEHALARQDAVALPDVAEEEFVLFCQGLQLQKMINKIFLETGIKPRSHFRAATDSMVTQLVESGVGVALIPLSRRLKSYNVKILHLKDAAYYREICMNWLKGKELLIPNKRLRDFILSYYEENLP